MLRFHRIFRVRRSDCIFFVLRIDPNNVGRIARRYDREKQQCWQNSEGRFHTLTNRKTPANRTCHESSRREWSRRESSDMDKAPKGGERAGASESIEVRVNAFH